MIQGYYTYQKIIKTGAPQISNKITTSLRTCTVAVLGSQAAMAVQQSTQFLSTGSAILRDRRTAGHLVINDTDLDDKCKLRPTYRPTELVNHFNCKKKKTTHTHTQEQGGKQPPSPAVANRCRSSRVPTDALTSLTVT